MTKQKPKELTCNKHVTQVSNCYTSKPKELDWEKVAFLFHNTYEGLAPKFGYETRKDTKAFDTKSQNGQLMIATCKAVVSHYLTQQRTELENQKVKVVWNDVCEQIKQEARTELLEEIKKILKPIGMNGKKGNLSIEKAYSRMNEIQANTFRIRIKAINKDRKGKLKEITNLLNKKDE